MLFSTVRGRYGYSLMCGRGLGVVQDVYFTCPVLTRPRPRTERLTHCGSHLNHRLTTSQLDFISVCEANPVFL